MEEQASRFGSCHLEIMENSCKMKVNCEDVDEIKAVMRIQGQTFIRAI